MIMRPLTAAALLAALQGASAGTSTFVTTMCTNITPSVWRKAACWTPSPPTEADTVVIPAGPPVYVNTTWDVDSKWNYTDVEALVIDGLTVNHGARLVLLQGSFELRGTASIQGLLELQAPPSAEANQSRNTLNKADLKEDTASRALGLRDCAYTPIGFTPRLCGAGTFVVEAGGELSVSGLYASVFSRVQVKTGGTYKLADRAHPFGLVQNEGSVTVGDVYWHGLLENQAGGIANLAGLIWFDEYSHAGEGNDSKPEKFTQDPFINEGTMTVTGNVRSTWFLYEWLEKPEAQGIYLSSFRNRGNGRLDIKGPVSISGLTVDSGSVHLYQPLGLLGNITNNGTLHIEARVSVLCNNLFGNGVLNVTGVLNTHQVEASTLMIQSGTVSATTLTAETIHQDGGYVRAADCRIGTGMSLTAPANFNCGAITNEGAVQVMAEYARITTTNFTNTETGWLSVVNSGQVNIHNFVDNNKTGGFILYDGTADIANFVWPSGWTSVHGSLTTTIPLTLTTPFTVNGSLFCGALVLEEDMDVVFNDHLQLAARLSATNLTTRKTLTVTRGSLDAARLINTGEIHLDGAPLSVSGNCVTSGDMQLSHSRMRVGGNFTTSSSVTLTNSPLQVQDTLNSTGLLSLNGSLFEVSGTFNNLGSFRSVDETNPIRVGTLHNNGSIIADAGWRSSHLQNDGVFQVTSISATYLLNDKTIVSHGAVDGICNHGDLTFTQLSSNRMTFLQNFGTANVSGVADSIENSGNLVMNLSSSDVTKVTQVNASSGSRTLLTGGNTEINAVSSAGVILFDSMQVWVHRVQCDSCHFFFADDAELHLIGPSGWRAPRGMLKIESGLAERGTPAVCTHDGACHKDPCPYEGHSMADRCFWNGTIPGVLYFAGDKEFCYACSSVHPLGSVNDVAAMRQLGAAPFRLRNSTVSVPGPAPLALAPMYSFKHATVESDGTGALVMTTVLHLHGDDALQVKRTRVHALTEHSRPVFVGGGRLTLQKRSELRLGLEAILDGGGSIDALPGSAVIVEHFASVVARNHSLRVAKGAKMRVDGTMHFHKHSTVESCGRSVGAGTLVMDDPAESARTCAEAATCLAECKTDADCGSGLCSSCSGAHGDSQGVCVEPGCQTDEDCSLNGQCEGGVCVSCDLNGLPFVGPHCTTLLPSSATYDWQTGRNAMTGDVANMTYSLELQTVAPPGCAVGGPDDMASTPDQMRQPGARNMKLFGGVRYFDYTYPPSGCNWTLGICAGLGTNGCQCNRTTASDCGCEPSCTNPKLPPGVCPSYITTNTDWYALGDCGPTARGCFCGRDGVQQVHGTKGCPSNAFVMPAGGNSTDVLMYYNMGDGKSVGLATGPKRGPWTVVKEPVAEGVQDVFVMKNVKGHFHMFATGVKDQNIVHGYSRDGKSWTVVDAPVLPMKVGNMTFKTRTHPWVSETEPAFPLPNGTVVTIITAVTSTSDGLQKVMSQDFASVTESK